MLVKNTVHKKEVWTRNLIDFLGVEIRDAQNLPDGASIFLLQPKLPHLHPNFLPTMDDQCFSFQFELQPILLFRSFSFHMCLI
jgi:hypothetical protein